ncbi:hypothetical protein BM1_02235 [Bipolaris maydis]|nr:hypothetical protein BM1_02235 [Bipolaris maydis]
MTQMIMLKEIPTVTAGAETKAKTTTNATKAVTVPSTIISPATVAILTTRSRYVHSENGMTNKLALAFL